MGIHYIRRYVALTDSNLPFQFFSVPVPPVLCYSMFLQEVLSTLASAVASSTSALITHAQKIASMSDDQAMKDRIYAAAKETADATKGLLTAANMVGSSADYSLCQEQLTEACKKAIGKVEKLVLSVQVSQVKQQPFYGCPAQG